MQQRAVESRTRASAIRLANPGTKEDYEARQAAHKHEMIHDTAADWELYKGAQMTLDELVTRRRERAAREAAIPVEERGYFFWLPLPLAVPRD